MSFTLNNLSDTDFENFCFDVLHSLDFVNLSWRKGTGLASSPSDQGRDIQGQLLKKDVDGSEHHETWFIECKHYVKGVPPDRIYGALAWANAERPDVLLIIASNFLSNPAKNYLDDYKKENKPPYRIKVWERTDLENLTACKNEIRRKYNLATEIAFLSILNNYHIIYSMKPQLNTIEYFIELMDSLEPGFREPITGNEKVADLKIDADDYAAFRKKCLSIGSEASPNFVHKMVSSTLAWWFHLADTTALSDLQNRYRGFIEYLKAKIAAETDESRRAKLSRMLDFPQKFLKELPETLKLRYGLYTYICNELVRKLLAEKPSITIHSTGPARKAAKAGEFEL